MHQTCSSNDIEMVLVNHTTLSPQAALHNGGAGGTRHIYHVIFSDENLTCEGLGLGDAAGVAEVQPRNEIPGGQDGALRQVPPQHAGRRRQHRHEHLHHLRQVNRSVTLEVSFVHTILGRTTTVVPNKTKDFLKLLTLNYSTLFATIVCSVVRYSYRMSTLEQKMAVRSGSHMQVPQLQQLQHWHMNVRFPQHIAADSKFASYLLRPRRTAGLA